MPAGWGFRTTYIGCWNHHFRGHHNLTDKDKMPESISGINFSKINKNTEKT